MACASASGSRPDFLATMWAGMVEPTMIFQSGFGLAYSSVKLLLPTSPFGPSGTYSDIEVLTWSKTASAFSSSPLT